MAEDRSKTPEEEENGAPSKREHKSKRKVEDESESESEDRSRRSEEERKRSDRSKKKRSRSSKRRSRSYWSSEDNYSNSDDSYSNSESESSDYSSESRSESEDEEAEAEERKEEKRGEREGEAAEAEEREREEEKKRRRKESEEEKKKKDKMKDKHRGKKGAVTNSWGKYGIIRETDLWNKRLEFTAWLAEVKQVNLESLPNWEEKQMFKEFMEDHNTATFPSKKYYDLDAHYIRKMEKEQKKGFKKVLDTERTIFNDEEQRRQELLQAREKQKEEQVEALKHSMQSGVAQAMKEQAQLREEMAYQYKLGNFEAAAASQRRLDPDVAL